MEKSQAQVQTGAQDERGTDEDVVDVICRILHPSNSLPVSFFAQQSLARPEAGRTLKSKFSFTSPSVRPCMRASRAMTLKRRRAGSSS